MLEEKLFILRWNRWSGHPHVMLLHKWPIQHAVTTFDSIRFSEPIHPGPGPDCERCDFLCALDVTTIMHGSVAVASATIITFIFWLAHHAAGGGQATVWCRNARMLGPALTTNTACSNVDPTSTYHQPTDRHIGRTRTKPVTRCTNGKFTAAVHCSDRVYPLK